jgi:uncharacterized RDD family membrane protein YckC
LNETLSIQVSRCTIPQRIMSYAIDLGVLTAIMYLGMIICMLLFFLVIGGLGILASLSEGLAGLGGIAMVVIFVGVMLVALSFFHVYFIYQEFKHGTTFGKRMLGLKVISEDGARLTLMQCVLRDLARYIDALLILPGLIAMSLSSERRRLGDHMAGTRVIYSSQQAQRENFFFVTQQDYWRFFDKLRPQPLTQKTRRTFLKQAFYQATTDTGAIDQAWLQQWLDLLCNEANVLQQTRINSQALFLFFAELCRQTELEEQTKKVGHS